jgi:hypothetical protein
MRWMDGWMDMHGMVQLQPMSRLPYSSAVGRYSTFLGGYSTFLSIHAECNVQKTSLIKFSSVMVLLLREKNDAPFNLFFSCLNNPIVSEEHV